VAGLASAMDDSGTSGLGSMKVISVIMWAVNCLRALISYLLRMRADEKKRRIDLYDRRIPVFNTIRDYMWLVASGNEQKDNETAFLQNTQDVSFLFGKDIKSFVDEVFHKYGKLHVLVAMQNQLSGKALQENLEKQNAIREWFMKEAKHLDHRFARYLNL
jgi:hypothetical protein